ncbi:MAG: hypothetical protein ABW133_25890, partial [Polyangiaceae bacterium]
LSCAAATRPIAWSLSIAGREGEPFFAQWHAEQATGKRAPEMPRTAVLPRAPFVRARVYFADGKVASPHTTLSTSDSHPGAKNAGGGAHDETGRTAEPTSWFEAPS